MWCSLSCKRDHDTQVALINDIATLTRKCKKCGLIKPLEVDFYLLPGNRRRRECRTCVMAGNAERGLKPDTADKRRTKHLMGLYGITSGEYEQLLTAQGGRCAVCRRPPLRTRLAVDHDHRTGFIRGLLCNHCNLRVIGKQVSPDVFRSAAEYLGTPPARQTLGDRIVPNSPTKKRTKRKRRTI